MTIATDARPRVAGSKQAGVWTLARLEAGRMLRSPAPWVGLALMLWLGYDGYQQTWAAARYQALQAALAPLLLGVSIASAYAFGRERTPVADEAPMDASTRSAARLLGGLSLVALVGVVVAVAAVWLRLSGGMPLGDEPGRTLHANYSVGELLQPVLLAAFAVAFGAALVHVLRHRLVTSIVLFVVWFLAGATYWVFNGSVARWVTLLQVQPVYVEAGPSNADLTAFPVSWVLSAPSEFQDYWARLVVSPAMAAWHDVYLVALTMLAVAVAVPGRLRKPLAVAGVLLAVAAVLLQRTVSP